MTLVSAEVLVRHEMGALLARNIIIIQKGNEEVMIALTKEQFDKILGSVKTPSERDFEDMNFQCEATICYDPEDSRFRSRGQDKILLELRIYKGIIRKLFGLENNEFYISLSIKEMEQLGEKILNLPPIKPKYAA